MCTVKSLERRLAQAVAAHEGGGALQLPQAGGEILLTGANFGWNALPQNGDAADATIRMRSSTYICG